MDSTVTTSPASPKTDTLPHDIAQRTAAEHCKNNDLPQFTFSSETTEHVVLINLAHPENRRMQSTDRRILCAVSGVPGIWVMANTGTKRRSVA